MTLRALVALFLLCMVVLSCGPVTAQAPSVAGTQLLHVDLSRGLSGMPALSRFWGAENISFHPLSDGRGPVMRVFVPRGAIDPATMSNRGLPRGGAGFLMQAFPHGVEHALLSYYVRFPADFDFVRGGKLPGLYGGLANSGGRIPNGTDGFSFRLMWGAGGNGSVYAYLPTSVKWGTPLLRHRFRFIPGHWHLVVQEVRMNDPGKANGSLRMWIDNVPVGEESGLMIRAVESLRINGMFFDVFFGGNDDSWAAAADTHVEFSCFTLRGYW